MNLQDLLVPSQPKATWRGYDFSKTSLVFVARSGFARVEKLHALYTAGGALRLLVDEYDDMFDVIAPPIPSFLLHQGFYVLECNLVGGREIQTINGPDWQDAELAGTYRLPTDEEMRAVLAGRAPWNDVDWLDPKQVVKEDAEV